MNNCQAVEKRLAEAFDNGQLIKTSEDLHLHLEQCDSCRGYQRFLQNIDTSIGSLKTIALPQRVFKAAGRKKRSKWYWAIGSAIAPIYLCGNTNVAC